VGILGNGAIGQTVAKILKGFDCDIKIFSRTAIEGQVWSWSDIGAYLPDLDILVACLPETTETIGLIDEAFLNQMKKEALFVNVGRGSAVDEPVLIEKLQAGAIAGAVLDVTAVEPLPENHVLWNMPNVLLTQHSSGAGQRKTPIKSRYF
jgi:phosphoglycerate dehydrogenase-like enzyme